MDMTSYTERLSSKEVPEHQEIGLGEGGKLRERIVCPAAESFDLHGRRVGRVARLSRPRHYHPRRVPGRPPEEG